MSGAPNVAASVMARLLSRAKSRGDDYQLLVTAYAYERLLYRLGQSPVRDRFVLKGAMLLRLWSEQPYRATRDLDLLRRGDGSLDAIRSDLQVVLATAAPDDGLTFDASGLLLESIQADREDVGTRAILPARCGRARLSLQVDLGVGDAVWPAPEVRRYPTLLDAPPPEVLAYERETVVAEKLESVIVLGDRNSRIKDFFDLHMLATTFSFDRRELGESVRRTFARRKTPIPDVTPIGLTAAYWANPSRPAQVRAFSRRAGLAATAETAQQINAVLTAFLLPVLDDVAVGVSRPGNWQPGGPWR
jgi:hypothetical protein